MINWLQYTTFSFGWGDVPALLVLLATIVVFVKKYKKLKREVKELEDQLTYLSTEDFDSVDGMEVASIQQQG